MNQMKISEALAKAETKLQHAGIKTSRLDSLVLLEWVSKIDRSWLLAHGNHSMSKDTQAKFNKVIRQREQRVPLAYITKSQEFWGLKLKVTPDVLIPRPETEKLVELALESSNERVRVLEVGTGSGAIAIALAKERSDWKIMASDVSVAALKVAQSNAKKHDVKIEFIKSDLFADISGSFDVIVANLPYVKTGAKLEPELKKEPGLALFGGADGLDYYRKVFEQVVDHLKTSGIVIIEANPDQQVAIKKLAALHGLGKSTSDHFALALREFAEGN